MVTTSISNDFGTVMPTISSVNSQLTGFEYSISTAESQNPTNYRGTLYNASRVVDVVLPLALAKRQKYF